MSNNTLSIPIVTIDGPSGSGKGTIAAMLAKELGWHLLDSGALYRLTALSAIKHQVDLNDEESVASLARSLNVQFIPAENSAALITLFEGISVDIELRTETMAANASKVAALPLVRDALLQRQRHFAVVPGLIADGRDMGTVVFPEAPIKFFLTASAEERTKRRLAQLQSKGIHGNFSDVLADINARDQRDKHRVIAPLKPAVDAIIINSSSLSINDVFHTVIGELRKKGLLL
ncbi:MAG: (d)CMP kinase [Endozoicomonas sp. (ex Botrylloides leachii)]|nr:(d)CMP kinase [Endozoicomonas sp. (ex Botrylloides leachii)]